MMISLTVKLSHFIRDSTSSLDSWRNSSLSTKLTKCFRMYFSAAFLSSSQLWVSANVLMPKQFDGSNCCSKNSQHALCTSEIKKTLFTFHNLYITIYGRHWYWCSLKITLKRCVPKYWLIINVVVVLKWHQSSSSAVLANLRA